MDAPPDPQAFGHLLHDVASRVSSLGLLVDTFEPRAGVLSADDRETLEGLRQSTDDLRRFVASLGELARTEVRGPGLQLRDERVGGLLRRALDSAIADGIELSVSAGPADLAATADVRLVTTLLRALLRQLGQRRVPVSLTASSGDGTVCLTVSVERAAGASLTLDYFYHRVANACGGSFAWVADGRGRAAIVTLPAAAADRSRSVA